MNVLTRGVRNTFRNMTRAVSIIAILGLSLGLCLLMLIANKATNSRTEQALSSIGTSIVVSAGHRGQSFVGTELDKLRTLSHVDHITMLNDEGRLQPAGTTEEIAGNGKTRRGPTVGTTSLRSSGTFDTSELGPGETLPSNFATSIEFVGTNRPDDAAGIGLSSSSLPITQGAAFDGSKDQPLALVSSALAAKNDLTVGSTFTAYSQTFTVAGVYTDRYDAVIVALPTAQRLLTHPGKITRAVVTVNSLRNLAAVTDKIRTQMPTAEVMSGLTQAENTLAPLNSVQRVSFLGLLGAALASALILLMTMIMIVRERRREIGILKAIGGSNMRIMVQFVCEALTFTIVGAMIGLVIGVLGGSAVTNAMVANSAPTATEIRVGKGAPDIAATITQIQVQIGWDLLLYAFGAAVVIALLGSALASLFISKVKPAQALRSE